MDRGEGEIFRDDGEWLRRLTHVNRLVGTVLRPEDDPAFLVFDTSRPFRTFELAHGELEEAEDLSPSDNPLINYEMSGQDEYADIMVESANYLLHEFVDAWANSRDLRDSVIVDYTDSMDTVSFDYAVARRNGYFDGPLQTATRAFTVWSIDLIGGDLDGVSIHRTSVRTHDDRAHLHIITKNDEVRFSYIHDRDEHPLVKECVAFFGSGTRLTRVLAGAFSDDHNLDSILEIVAESARGLVPEDESIALLQRVREAALLAQERELLAYTRPTLDQIDMMAGFLESVQAEQ